MPQRRHDHDGKRESSVFDIHSVMHLNVLCIFVVEINLDCSLLRKLFK
jgi:hypothetical protein